jgi:hypothetical protein
MARKKLLIIPTTDWLRDIPFRLRFLAAHLSKIYEIHVVRPALFSEINSLYAFGAMIHSFPMPQTSPFFREILLNSSYRGKVIKYAEQIIKEYGIDRVIVANPMLLSNNYNKYGKVIFDMADYYPEFIRRYLLSKGVNILEEVINRHIIGSLNKYVDLCVYSNKALFYYYKDFVRPSSVVLPNGYDDTMFNPSRISRRSDILSQLSSLLSIDPEKDLVVLFIGTFEYWVDIVRIFNFLHIISKIFNRDYQIKTIIAGKGPRLQEFLALRAFYNEYKVQYIGSVGYPLVPFIIYLSDFMLIPFNRSLTSLLSLPLKALEALALKKKVFYSNVLSLKYFHNAFNITFLQLFEKYEAFRRELRIFSEKEFDNRDEIVSRSLSWKALASLYSRYIE